MMRFDVSFESSVTAYGADFTSSSETAVLASRHLNYPLPASVVA